MSSLPNVLARRPFLQCLAGAAFAPLAWASDTTMSLLVPWPAGGIVDSSARILQPELGRVSATNVVLENVPGAGGLIGLDRYARRPTGERGLLVGTNSELIATLLTNPGSSKLRPEDFRLVGMIAVGGFALVVRDGLPVRDFDSLVAYARTKPTGTLKFAHFGSGSLFHLAWEELAGRAGITALQVPYKGSPDLLRDLNNESVDLAFLPLTKAAVGFPGVRGLATSAAARHPLFPDLPTVTESVAGRGFQYEGWYALTVMRDTPAPELAKLERWASAAVQAPAFLEGSKQMGASPPPSLTRIQLDQFYDSEIARHRALVQRLNLGT